MFGSLVAPRSPSAASVAALLAIFCVSACAQRAPSGADSPPSPAPPVSVVAPAANVAPEPSIAAVAPVAPVTLPAPVAVAARGAAEDAASLPARQQVARLAWGSGANALGMTMGAEANPTAPMAIAGDSAGRLWILDQDNERVVRLAAASATFDLRLPVALRWPQDLALVERGAPGGQSVALVLVLDRLAESVVAALDAHDGSERWRLALRGDGAEAFDPDAAVGPTGLAFGGGVTGIFVHDDGVWAEWGHERVHQLGDLAGVVVRSARVLPGRPARVGDLGLFAMRAGDKVQITGRPLEASNAADLPPSFRAEVGFNLPVYAVRTLDSDPWGRVWIAANTLRESEAGAIMAEGLEVARVGRTGAVEFRDAATLEQGPHEQLRTFAVGAEGSFWHLARRDDGVVVERWAP